MTDGRRIFEKDQTFAWEGGEAVDLLKEKLKDLAGRRRSR